MVTRRHAVALGIALASLGVCGEARAAGFALSEQGAASGGLAGAATARRDVPEAGFYNPAAYATQREDFGFVGALGATLLSPTITHTGEGGDQTETTSALTPVPRLHLGGGVGPLGAGLSVGAPFGSSVTWPDDWPGRYELRATSLQVLELGVHLAYRPFGPLAISAGPRFQSSAVEISRGIDVVDPARDARVDILASGQGVGGQASLLFMPIEPLTLGLSYRSRVVHEMAGVADFQDVPIELEPSAHDDEVTTRFVMPDRLALGAAYDLGAATISLDVEHFMWATTDELVIDFADEQLTDVVQPRQWRGSTAARLGFEQRLLSDALALRLGFAYDQSPVPDATVGPSSPDSARLTVASGVGYQAPFGLLANLSLSYTIITEREATSPETLAGSYAGDFLALGFDLGFRLGR